MRVSQFLLTTLKEAPAEAEVVSHKLMLRAGLIRRLASGIYTWMPLGLRVLRKVEAVVREEMNRSGGIELLMPTVQPAELWQESGRWEQYGAELLRLKDRHERDFCLAPTAEEVVSDHVRREVRSYRQLPLNLYQIQTKFRDEPRPRFGVMRGREFLMKDAYSFHADKASLDATYREMYDCYSRIFTRLGLKFRAVSADTGSIGGTGSHEFHVLAESGEDAIAFCPDSDYAANVELAEALAPGEARREARESITKVETPGVGTIAELCAFLGMDPQQTVKSVVVDGSDGSPVLLLLRGDHELNVIKAGKLDGIASPVRFSAAADIERAFGARPGSLGPVGYSGRIIADRALMGMSDFATGANEDGQHYRGVNWGRDFPEPRFEDLRNVLAGDPSPDGKGKLELCRGIEVGHIFQLRTKYSSALDLKFLNEHGSSELMEMGCYGIGVTRVVAAAIEQNYDGRGIMFPSAMAPFQIAIVPIGFRKSERVRETALALHDELTRRGVEVLLDDRDERPGIMFADTELIGIPHRVVVGERGLKDETLEYQARSEEKGQPLPVKDAVEFLQARLESI